MEDFVVEIPQDLVEEKLVVDVDVADEEVSRQALQILIPLLVIGVGCVVIWPATVPKTVIHRPRGVVMYALPVEAFLNPGIKAQKPEDVVAQYASVG